MDLQNGAIVESSFFSVQDKVSIPQRLGTCLSSSLVELVLGDQHQLGRFRNSIRMVRNVMQTMECDAKRYTAFRDHG
jgi:hypothetical protein